MKNYSTKFSILLLFVTIVLQSGISWIGRKITSDKREEYSSLVSSATNEWIATQTSIALNPPTLTPTPSETPQVPTPTPIACIASVSVNSFIYLYPVRGVTDGAVPVGKGDRVTLIGRLSNEPWWHVKTSQLERGGWIEDGSIVHEDDCNNVLDNELASIINSLSADQLIVQDSFNGFDVQWRDLDGEIVPHPISGNYAQLRLEDRSSQADSEFIAHLSDMGVPVPFGFIVSVTPFSFDNNSYFGFRYKAGTNADNNWVQFKLYRRNCSVEWAYSIDGEVTTNPLFPLGEEASCGNDNVADFLKVGSVVTDSTGAIRFSGSYNNTAIPPLTFFDREATFAIGSFELVVSKSDTKLDFIVIYEAK